VARDVKELASEMERLAKEDPAALEYHLREGHITAWLSYIGEARLAESLRGSATPGRRSAGSRPSCRQGARRPQGREARPRARGLRPPWGLGPAVEEAAGRGGRADRGRSRPGQRGT